MPSTKPWCGGTLAAWRKKWSTWALTPARARSSLLAKKRSSREAGCSRASCWARRWRDASRSPKKRGAAPRLCLWTQERKPVGLNNASELLTAVPVPSPSRDAIGVAPVAAAGRRRPTRCWAWPGDRTTKTVQKHCCRLAAETSFASASEHLREMLRCAVVSGDGADPGSKGMRKESRLGFKPRTTASAQSLPPGGPPACG